jgi:predicted dehydrogenase
MKNVYIIGCGSIGNHLANASRHLGWNVMMGDIDPAAIERARSLIYPGRYGHWDPAISFGDLDEMDNDCLDLVIVGTPPDTHLALALQALERRPKAILIEKPLAGIDLDLYQPLIDKAADTECALFVGYDHAVSEVVGKLFEIHREFRSSLGPLLSVDVNFREHWGGIFAAHPWLDGPNDSYLGFSSRGGGALGEHSHGLHLFYVICEQLGGGSPREIFSTIKASSDEGCDYDAISLVNIVTNKGVVGRCAQDVVTKPTAKNIQLQFLNGHISVEFKPSGDSLRFINNESGSELLFEFKKNRPDDFIRELQHLDHAIQNGRYLESPLRVETGYGVMQIINAAFRSNNSKAVEFI